MDEVLALLKSEEKRLVEHRAGRERECGSGDGASSPGRTAIGLGEMTSGLRASIDGLDLYAGFTVLSPEKQAGNVRRQLRLCFLWCPSGGEAFFTYGACGVHGCHLLRDSCGSRAGASGKLLEFFA
ncbi:hypothetical protein [Streptomyces sp. t99]|uniref:hypothetical protein n=3 Tax=Streptomyces TaxID=1883 RepID=UPI000BFE13F1|nr:hypothetical protein [Streptomyces sp. t99]